MEEQACGLYFKKNPSTHVHDSSSLSCFPFLIAPISSVSPCSLIHYLLCKNILKYSLNAWSRMILKNILRENEKSWLLEFLCTGTDGIGNIGGDLDKGGHVTGGWR